MKYITKIILTSIFMLITTWAFSQVHTVINNMTYINGTPITNCGTIDFGANPTVRIQFIVDLDKPINQSVGDGYIYIYTKKTSSSYRQEQVSYSVPSSLWFDNTSTNTSTATFSFDVTMYADSFNLYRWNTLCSL